ncbi:MAG: hypothetical protein JW768_14960 [Chitinispirillaceae bacterium]|nr:hypothetical protein [Chitinispirillaceae bacterium]
MKAQTITIVIGGCALGFVVANAGMARRIKKRYYGWIVDNRATRIRFVCLFVKRPGKGRTAMPRMNKVTFARGRIERTDFRCTWSQGSGILRLDCSIYSFDACLRVLVSALLPNRHAVLVHAAAIVTRGGRGYVFAGRSGAGKTTTVRLLSGEAALNDELCVLRVDRAGVVRVSGTPFWGEMGSGPAFPGFFRAAGLYFLNKQPATKIVRLEREETCAHFLQVVCHFSKQAHDMQRMLVIASRIANAIPAYDLCFRPYSDEIRSAVFGGGGETFNEA